MSHRGGRTSAKGSLRRFYESFGKFFEVLKDGIGSESTEDVSRIL